MADKRALKKLTDTLFREATWRISDDYHKEMDQARNATSEVVDPLASLHLARMREAAAAYDAALKAINDAGFAVRIPSRGVVYAIGTTEYHKVSVSENTMIARRRAVDDRYQERLKHLRILERQWLIDQAVCGDKALREAVTDLMSKLTSL